MQIKEFNIRMPRSRKRWQSFMEKNGITGFAPSDVGAVEKTYVWFADDGDIAASGSIAGNVLKYVAVCSKYKNGGSLFNEVVSHLVSEEASRGRFHLFVFTKPKYVNSFGYVGFKPLGQTDQAALLETGTPGIQDFLQQLPKFDSGITGAIVMNANPFTKGHRALVERASQECDHVYLFVVQAERSLFTFQERFALVKAGVKDLTNVVVVPGGEYMVSSATFPAYFLKSDQDIGQYQAKLDASIFLKSIAVPLNITRRYLGEEPNSKTTASYNQMLQAVLPPKVTVEIMSRKTFNGEVISATKVRQAITEGRQELIEQFLPVSTAEFVKAHFTELKNRISTEGK